MTVPAVSGPNVGGSGTTVGVRASQPQKRWYVVRDTPPFCYCFESYLFRCRLKQRYGFVVGFNNDTVDFVCFTFIIVLEIVNNKKRLKYYVFSSVYLAPSFATETKCNETSLAKERLRGDVYQIFS